MPTIAAGHFEIDAPYMNELELERYARALFAEFDRAAATTLRLPDYGIHLELEEGSLKGRGRVVSGTQTFLKIVIAIGGLDQGIHTVAKAGKATIEVLSDAAERLANLPPDAKRERRNDPTTVSRIARITAELKAGRLTHAQATERVIACLQEDGSFLPDALALDVARSIAAIPSPAQQVPLSFLSDYTESPSDTLPSLPSRSRGPKRETPLPPRRLHIEIWRDTLDGPEQITIVPM